jgi:NAD(P)H-hydrate epimerase
MKVATAAEMRDIDRTTIEKYAIPGSVLMERAGLAVAQKVRELFEKKKVIVLAGGGNNGGDGIAAARNLHNWGWNVRVLLMLREDKLSPDCLAQYRIAKQTGVTVEFRREVSERDLHGAIVIDALLGTGINKAVTSPMTDVIRFLNESPVKVISVDVPSGISSDTGQVMGEAVRADITITFGIPKIGHILFPGADHAGSLFIEDIGFPEVLLNDDRLLTETLERNAISMRIPERHKYSYKGAYGHILIVAGSKGKTGAAIMAAEACLRSGAGMVTVGVPETLADVFQVKVKEEMVLPLPDTGDGTLSAKAFEKVRDFLAHQADVLAIGPGITVSDDTFGLVTNLLETVTVPMVLDADALNVIGGRRELFRKVKAPLVLTPHAGEMARLLKSGSGRSSKERDEYEARKEVEAGRISISRSYARETGVYLVLKGVPTIIADPEGRILVNTTGNPGMATAGAGDVLTGMIAGFLGQGLNPRDASCVAVYLHGLAGDISSKTKGMHSLIASDIIEMIPGAFLSLASHA